MRGGSEYSADDAAQMETKIEPCRFTKGMAGLWDSDGDGLADVLTTYPDTRIATVFADTLDTSLNLAVLGETWDVPYPAPPRYVEPQTINSIHTVEYSIDNGPWRPASPLDGMFTQKREEYVLRLPELGGGTHRLRTRGVNTVARFDRSPPEFARPRRQAARRVRVHRRVGSRSCGRWTADFDGKYSSSKSRRGENLAGGRLPPWANDRHHFFDVDVLPGHFYRYRLQVDIPGRWTRTLSTATATRGAAGAARGTGAAVAPNPSSGGFLFTVLTHGPAPGT